MSTTGLFAGLCWHTHHELHVLIAALHGVVHVRHLLRKRIPLLELLRREPLRERERERVSRPLFQKCSAVYRALLAFLPLAPTASPSLYRERRRQRGSPRKPSERRRLGLVILHHYITSQGCEQGSSGISVGIPRAPATAWERQQAGRAAPAWARKPCPRCGRQRRRMPRRASRCARQISSTSWRRAPGWACSGQRGG